jgi:hypothetical protein
LEDRRPLGDPGLDPISFCQETGVKSTVLPQSRGRAPRIVAPIRLQLELLESRWLPGETLGLSLSTLGLMPALLDLSGLQGAGQADSEPGRHDRPALLRQSTLPQDALTWGETSPDAEGRRPPSTNPAASASIQPTAGNRTSDLSDDGLALAAALHRARFPAVSTAEALHAGFTAPATLIRASHPGTTAEWSASGRSGSAEQLPSLPVTARNGSAASRLIPNSAAFDPWTGQLAIRADGADHTIQENATAGGFLTINFDGQPHASDPASPAFDPLLAGATAAHLTGIRLDASGGPDTLVLGTQQLAGGLSVNAPGATVVTHDVSVAGPLVFQAADLTVRGALQASGIILAATGWVNIEDTGRVAAGNKNTGGAIAVLADKFVNTGQLHADGPTGGQIAAQANDILNAGSITADGTDGADGMVRVDFTGAYIDTAAALTSANGGGGAGGHVIIDGGATGHLFSSGRQQATGGVGGAVDLFGRELVLDGGAIDVSGENGAGSIRVGGAFHGANPAVVNAEAVTVTPATTFRADALQTGDGGRVAVWSDAATDFQGAVSARGSAAGGTGGAVEASSRGSLTYGGTVDAGETSGRNGTLLLDPKNLIVSTTPVGVFPQFDFLDPHPTMRSDFGFQVWVLGNGNVLVTNPSDSFGGIGAGALYLFNGLSGALISALVGNGAGAQVGFGDLTRLSNGNYLFRSLFWSGSRGAVTWGSGTAGVSGILSEANSLVGATFNDRVGTTDTNYQSGVRALSNGNYVIVSPFWNSNRGAATWGNGNTGTSGIVSVVNSLVGTNPNDRVGSAVTTLSNGNYVVQSPNWNGNYGAVTWGNGTTGTRGSLSETNSLVGTEPADLVDSGGITALSNGSYVVRSSSWNNDRGAVTWGSGTTGVSGTITPTNSLVGTDPGDRVGYIGVTALSNGNYVVESPGWNGGRGAATWGNGTTGISGVISSANSLVGSNPNDLVADVAVTPLSNENYVVRSPFWNGGYPNGRGAVTWGDGTTGVRGPVSAANSLVGDNPGDQVGQAGIFALTNGNYVVGSPSWNSNRGAATWGSGTSGMSGPISDANSLVGTDPGDRVGFLRFPALRNGNYVVESPYWHQSSGAATWGDGTVGVRGTISAANSFVGGNPGDFVAGGGIVALTNGNYVVGSPAWRGQLGAATWANGTRGSSGIR